MVLTHVDLIEKLLHYNRTSTSLPPFFACLIYPTANERVRDKPRA